MDDVVLARDGSGLTLAAPERSGPSVLLDARLRLPGVDAVVGCTVGRTQLAAWRADLATMHERLAGQARLESAGLLLTVQVDAGGRLQAEGRLDTDRGWGDGSRAVVQFTLPPLDQTDLPAALAALDAVLLLQDPEQD